MRTAQLAESDSRYDLSKDMLTPATHRRLGRNGIAGANPKKHGNAHRTSSRDFGARRRVLLRQSEKERESGASASSPRLRRRVCFLVGKFAAEFPKMVWRNAAAAHAAARHSWPPLSDARRVSSTKTSMTSSGEPGSMKWRKMLSRPKLPWHLPGGDAFMRQQTIRWS